MAPFFGEYQLVKARAKWDQCEQRDIEARIAAFHKRTASKAVDVILQLGGIYVKIGQFASTMGAGILEDEYIQALKPLQDGVPPRSLEEVSRIIEGSVGHSMQELFLSFDPIPLGAASIAQAHRATLHDGREIVVKIQYPEVASLYEADFDNLEVVTRWLFPENVPLIRGLRKRHSAELDFRVEADNLREVGANLRKRGFEPALVRVPTVPDPRLCTQHVLGMELLRGGSLARAIEDEMADVARALGLGGAGELRAGVMRRLQQHFEGGGGAERFVQAAEYAAPLVRLYSVAAWRWRSLAATASLWLALILRPLARCLAIDLDVDAAAAVAAAARTRRPNLGRAIRTLVRVHGCAMLLDGVYNADPHPGNVLLLPDGRLGLIDYGMVGRLSTAERRSIARVTLGLAGGDVTAVVQEYERAGYVACWHSGERHGADAVFRFATFHLDRIDLSPVRLRAHTEGAETSRGDAGLVAASAVPTAASAAPTAASAAPSAAPPGSKAPSTIPVMRLLHSTIEHSVPDWIEQARRLGGLLIGVGSQAGRPISLAHEWAPIAQEVLGALDPAAACAESESAGSGGLVCSRRATARLRTHLTGLT